MSWHEVSQEPHIHTIGKFVDYFNCVRNDRNQERKRPEWAVLVAGHEGAGSREGEEDIGCAIDVDIGRGVLLGDEAAIVRIDTVIRCDFDATGVER